MRGPLKRAISADRVRLALFEARPAGLTGKHLLTATELSEAQIRRGLAELRDIGTAEGLPPLIWTHADGYQYCEDVDVLEAYELAIFRRRLTEIGRLITGTIAPHAAMLPGDSWVQLVLTQLNGVQASFEALAQAHR